VISTGSAPETLSEPVRIPTNVAGGQVHGTILLVEDEDFVRHVTSEVLSFAGYEVLCARHAPEAMRVFRQHEEEVQLLLTDVVLPGRNGHDLARDLRAVRPTLKTMFISGYPENEAAKHGMQEKGAVYLSKPFSVESLIRTVGQALAEHGIAENGKASGIAGGE
jgi:two-component system cell cycle sensor histidine kinase/response regulator CckA